MSPRPQPFPFAELPAVSRAELRTAVRVRDAATHFVRPDAIASTLAELTGEPVTLTLRRTRALETAAASADGVGVAFAPAEENALDRAVLIDVEGALASALLARALRQRAPRVLDSSRGPSPEIAGALAALLHATLRRAHAGAPLRVVAAGPASALARDFAARHPSVVTAWVTVVLGSDAFDARVSVPEPLLATGPARAQLTPESLAALGDAPLPLPLVATTCLADRATLATLQPGDVFLLPAWPLRPSGELFSGHVALVPPRAERGLGADLGEDGRLMLGSGPLEAHPWDRPIGEAMTAGENPTLQVLEDAPVVVRVELGTLEMTAREWASLAPGDVVTLGRRLGDLAILRVGGVEVARGELVQVDGEYGVRIAHGGR